MSYIVKELLLEKAKRLQGNPFGAVAIVREIEKVDAFEIVRCKDCIYCENMKCTELKDNTGHPLDVAIFDYCSQGVRK